MTRTISWPIGLLFGKDDDVEDNRLTISDVIHDVVLSDVHDNIEVDADDNDDDDIC